MGAPGLRAVDARWDPRDRGRVGSRDPGGDGSCGLPRCGVLRPLALEHRTTPPAQGHDCRRRRRQLGGAAAGRRARARKRGSRSGAAGRRRHARGIASAAGRVGAVRTERPRARAPDATRRAHPLSALRARGDRHRRNAPRYGRVPRHRAIRGAGRGGVRRRVRLRRRLRASTEGRWTIVLDLFESYLEPA